MSSKKKNPFNFETRHHSCYWFYLFFIYKQYINSRDVIWQRKVAIGNESLPSSLPSLIAKSRWLRGKVTFQGKIFSFLIKLLWIISILYLYYCCTIYKLLFGIKGTRISHVFHDFCWLHLNFPIIMEHEPFTSSLPLFGNLGNECHFSLPKLPKNRRRI